MRQYQVPQFITVEDKVIGPLTVKQGVYLGIAAVLIFFIYALFTQTLALIISVIIGTFAVALAFFKINGQPFPIVLKNFFLYSIRPRRYIWKQQEAKKGKEVAQAKQQQATTVKTIPKISESKLSDLAWSLDIKSHSEEEKTEE